MFFNSWALSLEKLQMFHISVWRGDNPSLFTWFIPSSCRCQTASANSRPFSRGHFLQDQIWKYLVPLLFLFQYLRPKFVERTNEFRTKIRAKTMIRPPAGKYSMTENSQRCKFRYKFWYTFTMHRYWIRINSKMKPQKCVPQSLCFKISAPNFSYKKTELTSSLDVVFIEYSSHREKNKKKFSRNDI